MRLSSARVRLAMWNVGILAAALLVALGIVFLAVRLHLTSSVDQRLVRATKVHETMSRRRAERQARPGSPAGAPEARAGTREQTPPSSGPSEGPEARPPGPPGDPGESSPPGAAATPSAPRGGAEVPPAPRTWPALRVFNRAGQLLGRDRQLAQEQEKPWDQQAYAAALGGEATFSTVPGEDALLRVYTCPLVLENQQAVIVQASFSLHEVQTLLEGLATIILILVPCVLVVAGLGGLFLTSRALRPVREITHTAARLDAEDLSQRLPVFGADEFAGLATTMNGMLARLEEAFTRLKLSFERERRFTADASHELRTPLTAIKANTSLALKGERTPQEYRQALQAIHTASDTMQRIVEDLLLLARSGEGQLKLELAAVEARKLLEETVASRGLVPAQASITVTVAPGTGQLWGDAHHLRMLLYNLLDNALRHTPAKGRIDLEARAEKGSVVLTVSDTGEGIAPEHLEHLGEPFYRPDDSRARTRGGAGLGLAISRSIVAAHHGTMEITSTPGVGTRVTVTLPPAAPASPTY